MPELGDNIDEYHKEIGMYVATKDIDFLYTYGNISINIGIGAIAAGFQANKVRHKTPLYRGVMHRELVNMIEPGTTVLVKGASRLDMYETVDFSCQYYSTGSKDVLKITSYKEFNYYMRKLLEKYPGGPILIEEYLDGPQYLVETIVNEGNLNIIAIFKQEITFGERFIITGYGLLNHQEDGFYNKLKSAVETIISKHGLKYGPCHLEMRLVKHNWKLVEINPRISGGGMNDLIKAGLGINLVKETLKILIGQKPNFKPQYTKNVFAQYVTVSESGILKRVIGRNISLKAPGVIKVYIKPRKGSFLTPPLSMGNRYAYIIATGNTAEEAKINARFAASHISFKLMSDNENIVLKDLKALPQIEEK